MREGEVLVLVGCSLEAMTNGKLEATSHYVKNTDDRVSVPFLLRARSNYQIDYTNFQFKDKSYTSIPSKYNLQTFAQMFGGYYST